MRGRWGWGEGFAMKGQMGVRERGEISGNTHMLESGHAQLHFHIISKILVC